eukprot:5671953-Alexandrium_andersonii.AAC.1
MDRYLADANEAELVFGPVMRSATPSQASTEEAGHAEPAPIGHRRPLARRSRGRSEPMRSRERYSPVSRFASAASSRRSEPAPVPSPAPGADGTPE